MAKKIRAIVKVQAQAGKATPAPPIGPALGQHGINIMMFVKEFNERTASQAGMVIPAEITVFEDRTFTFIIKTPPAADLLKKAAGVDKGSAVPQVTARSIAKQLQRLMLLERMVRMRRSAFSRKSRTPNSTRPLRRTCALVST